MRWIFQLPPSSSFRPCYLSQDYQSPSLKLSKKHDIPSTTHQSLMCRQIATRRLGRQAVFGTTEFLALSPSFMGRKRPRYSECCLPYPGPWSIQCSSCSYARGTYFVHRSYPCFRLEYDRNPVTNFGVCKSKIRQDELFTGQDPESRLVYVDPW